MNEAKPPADSTPRWMVWAAGLLLVIGAVAAYWNSFSGPFIFDGQPTIVKNPTIRQLSSSWSPPANTSSTGRPLVNFSFAVNHALGGLSPRGYHVLNLAFHILTGLVLFGLVRRTLLLPRWSGRFGKASLPLALSIALLWALHPLLSMAVTYVAQRSELMMGLFYLLTLYCFVRGTQAVASKAWYASAVVSCLLGMASKEVMVSAPLTVLLYDRTFVAGTFREAWKQRWRLHLGLFATWLPLGYFVAGATDRGGMIGASGEVTWWTYLLTQSRAVGQYLKLSVWPDPLVFDYGRSVLAGNAGEVPLYLMLVLLLLVGTVVSLRRRPVAGFLGFCFFALLGPSSSVIPMPSELMTEHRMYLPLAVVVILLVLAAHNRLGSRIYGVLLAVAVVFLMLTLQRNEDYRTAESIWADTVAKCPKNERAHFNYGTQLLEQGRIEEGIGHYEKSLAILPYQDEAWNTLGNVYFRQKRVNEAIHCYETAIKLRPANLNAHKNLGQALCAKGLFDEGMGHFLTVLNIDPGNVDVRKKLGNVLLVKGRVDEAITEFREVIKLQPADVEAQGNLASALLQKGQWAEAVEHARAALESDPNDVAICNNLAWILAVSPVAAVRNGPEAVRLATQADRLTGGGNYTVARTLAAAYAEAGNYQEAMATARRGLQLAVTEAEKETMRRHLALYEAGRPYHAP